MVVSLYTIYDELAKESGPIFQAKNDSVAARMFNSMMMRDKLSPNEYSLYIVGTYDSEQMAISAFEKAEYIQTVVTDEGLRDGK